MSTSYFPVEIEGRALMPGRPTFVIAELGVNHDGSVQRAIELVRIASACGADAVKLQFFRASILMHPSGEMAAYQKQRLKSESPIDMLRKYELTGEEVRKVVSEVRERKMVPLATPFSPTDLELVDRLRLPAIKIASPDLVNRPLLAAAAKLRKPLLVSTGAATIQEVDETVSWLRQWRLPFCLMHCVSGYPTPKEEAHLCWITELAARYGIPAGYSDHTTDVHTGAFAAAAGAVVIEKHLTYDRDAKGPDHAASADPAHFERYVKLIREATVLRGAPGKRVLPVEEDVRTVSRQSLVLRRDLKAGDVLREEDLTVQRPGTGLPAAAITKAVGKRVARPLTAGSMLQWDMLADAA